MCGPFRWRLGKISFGPWSLALPYLGVVAGRSADRLFGAAPSLASRCNAPGGFRSSLLLRPQSITITTIRARQRKTIPPWRCNLPSRKLGSDRVPSSAIVNIRTAFFATDKGIAAITSRVFLHLERRKSWAKTRVVTTSIMVERMLLHDCATSMSSPGIDRIIPSRVTGV